MSKKYCYKFKSNFLKVDEGNAYVRPLIEKFGFEPVQEGEEGEYYWTGIWAKTVNVDKKSSVAKWVKRSIENIYKKEREVTDSKWIKEIKEAGYEFDDDGKLLENPHYLEGLTGQLCVDSGGNYAGTLYLNMSGCIEFYDSEALIGACFEDVMKLIRAEAVYKVRLETKERKRKKISRKGNGLGNNVIAKKKVDEVVNDTTSVNVHISDDALGKNKGKDKKPVKKQSKGQFLVKTKNGYYVCENTFTSLKDRAVIFDDFKAAKKAQKQAGGKVVKL